MNRLGLLSLIMTALLTGCITDAFPGVSAESASSLNGAAIADTKPAENRMDGSFKFVSNAFTGHPDNNELYLYWNTQASIDVKRYRSDGTEKELYQIDPEKRPIKQKPIVCGKNKQLYLLCSDGITACLENGSRYVTVVPGAYTAFTIVGEKIVYFNGTDGNLYACDLNGGQREVVMTDPEFAYIRESTLQDVSFLIDENLIYYVAAEPASGRPNTVKIYDMVNRTSTPIIALDDNVQMLWSTQEKVYFQNLINLGRDGQYKELYSVDKSTNEAKKMLDFRTAALLDGVVYYTQPDITGIFSWKNGSVCETKSGGRSIRAAADHRIYYSSTSNEPLHYFDVDTRETGVVQDKDFYGEALFQSSDNHCIGNHFY